MQALGSPAVLRDPGQGGPGSSPGLGLSPQLPGKTMAMEARSRRGRDGERGGHTGHTRGPILPAHLRGGGDTRDGSPSGTRCEERPSPNLYPPSHTPPTGAGQLQPKREKRSGGGGERIKSTMKRHNKHQLYPKSGAASFQQTSGCRGAELLLRTPIINLGEGGVGGTFPPSFPFVPLPRSAPRQKLPRIAAVARCSPGCSRGAAPRRRAGREGCGGPGAACRGAGLLLPIRPGRRRDTARTRTLCI